MMRQIEAEAARMLPAIEAEAARMLPEIETKDARRNAEMLREGGVDDDPRPPERGPVPPLTALGSNGGPSWMGADEWEKRLAAYRLQGRSPSDIRRVAEHLERRGPREPWTAAQQIDRAKSVGHVARVEYLSPEDEARALAPGAGGLPDARLERVRDRLLVVTPLGWVNPRSRTAYRAGIYSFVLRGTGYNEAATRSGRFTPGALLRLRREPDNPHDANALAVYAERDRNKAGYVPTGQAKRLAPLVDGGADLVAVSTRGSGAGSDDVTPHVLVCERALYDHLTRSR
ncbi:HIRAN domain-containing protein [Nocardioides aurantiacus]|nr:HIRAN domain-containing protein [Nocardioides aurantiacus]